MPRLSSRPTRYEAVTEAFAALRRNEKVNFLALLWRECPFLMDYSKMPSSLRKFHNAKAKRPK